MKNNILFAGIILAGNFFLVGMSNIQIGLYSIFLINIFLFSISFLGSLFQQKIAQKNKTTPSYFLAINFIRIFVCVLFLLPIIIDYEKSDTLFIYNFFIIYFSYLIIDLMNMKSKGVKFNE